MLSLILAIFLGLVDFFGFLSGEHTLNFVYLLLSFTTWHFLGLTLFLQNLNHKHQKTIYLVSAFLFGAVFFVFSQNYLSALLSASSFFLFQIYTERALSKRAKLFVNYSTREVVFPIIRRSFLFLMLILVVVGFFQGQRRAQKSELVTPYMIRTLSKPVVLVLNKQVGTQLQQQLKSQSEQNISNIERHAIINSSLSEILERIFSNTIGQLLGFNLQNIPVEKTIIYDSGEIDLTPVVNDLSQDIAKQINLQLNLYLPIIPLFFAALVFLFVSPLIATSEILLLPVIRAVIALLITLKIISINKETVEREVLTVNN